MGTSTIIKQAPPSDAATLRRTYQGMVEEDIIEYGRDHYSGHLNTKQGDGIDVDERRVFATAEAAADWMSPRASKRGPALAVRYVAERRPPDPAEAMITELHRAMAGIPRAAIEQTGTRSQRPAVAKPADPRSR